jgi:hypothetical protein
MGPHSRLLIVRLEALARSAALSSLRSSGRLRLRLCVGIADKLSIRPDVSVQAPR